MNFKMDHIVINAVDINNSLHFYTKILDLPGERIDEFKNNQVPFPSVRITKDTIIDLFPKKLWEKTNPENVCRPNLNHFCLSTNKKIGSYCRKDLRKMVFLLTMALLNAGELTVQGCLSIFETLMKTL